MFDSDQITIELDTKEIEKRVIESIAELITKYLISEIIEDDNFDLKKEVIGLFTKAIRKIVDEDSKEIRKEVKEEVIKRAVDKLMLDKKELLKELLK